MSRPVWGKSEVERIFSHEGIGDQWSGRYEGPEHDLDDHNFRLRRDFAVALAEERSGASGLILDLGCGAGPVLAELRARSLPCVGLDYSADMLRSATGRLRKRGLGRQALLRGDAERLPFADAAYDCVLCLGIISYLPDYGGVLAEIRRVLRPGGTALVTFRNVFNPVLSDPFEALKTTGLYLLRRQSPGGQWIGRPLRPRSVARALRDAGLRIESFDGMGFGPFSLGGRWRPSATRAIAASDRLMALTRRRGLRWIRRWLADVAMFVCRKD